MSGEQVLTYHLLDALRDVLAAQPAVCRAVERLASNLDLQRRGKPDARVKKGLMWGKKRLKWGSTSYGQCTAPEVAKRRITANG
jgi:hypothetical protein